MSKFSKEKILYEIWLTTRLYAGSTAYETLFEHYPSAYEIYRADPAELERIGISEKLISRLAMKDLRHANEAVEFCFKKGVDLIVRGEDDYPKRLDSIPNPPYALYVKGAIKSAENEYSTAVVGTRNMSEYGMRMAYKISYELAAAGAAIVSGMALGVDGVAAVGALEAGGDTIAVLGCGLDKIYPPAHRRLMGIIAERGALVSEYAPGTPPMSGNFPLRNRIISGLSRSTLVIEGNTNSGSMLTAREAIRQGRDIFAIPGNVGVSNALGTNVLIRDGARVALCARDIIAVRNDKGVDFDRLAEAELTSDLDIDILRSYGVAPAAYIAELAQREEIGRLDPAPQKTEKKKSVAPKSKKEVPTPEPEEPKPTLSPLPEGMMKDILESMPVGTPVSADFFAGFGLDPGKLVGYISMLEVSGYITSIPGGTYLRKF
ncbi:MAG: DNA-processing protein DprA [Clostridia bacterium]|nr:DNA-processing protein DprA [Clostridia bacterium]